MTVLSLAPAQCRLQLWLIESASCTLIFAVPRPYIMCCLKETSDLRARLIAKKKKMELISCWRNGESPCIGVVKITFRRPKKKSPGGHLYGEYHVLCGEFYPSRHGVVNVSESGHVDWGCVDDCDRGEP